jgi:hypothetical protein
VAFREHYFVGQIVVKLNYFISKLPEINEDQPGARLNVELLTFS